MTLHRRLAPFFTFNLSRNMSVFPTAAQCTKAPPTRYHRPSGLQLLVLKFPEKCIDRISLWYAANHFPKSLQTTRSEDTGRFTSTQFSIRDWPQFVFTVEYLTTMCGRRVPSKGRPKYLGLLKQIVTTTWQAIT